MTGASPVDFRVRHADRKETMKLTTWLKERELNCRRLAAGKTGSDRAGWIEDAEHFQDTLAAVEERDRLKKGPSNAMRDVAAERQRQIEAEGYDQDHDDEHVNDEIAALACFYAMPPGAREWDTSSTGYGLRLGDAILPHGWASIEDGDRRRELVKAGALILAEIERLDRIDINDNADYLAG
jgi:hypothetical protein